ncbi:hypothetical protein [Virgisporangium aurantiacum]|uniref:Uncharacterized protein n=1 Tax=Virgisporangium aurantiacum TaxID=175570 RepID=A0A8J4E5T4_9ACTN|nr:hypothetical protein [Virgisporangium aurantiacum]GIJ62666.1 hypothetical protein Vau01_101820 [Virgisporangium aurantiacum]
MKERTLDRRAEITGRLATMQRLELVIVQFEEVKRLIVIGRIPQLRLALILLDSAVELIMHRMVEAELRHERFHFDQLKQLRRLESWRHSGTPIQRQFATSGPSSDQLATEIQRLAPMVTPTAKRKKIDRVFGDKIDFLVERHLLPAEVAPALKKLHDYRNETYHRDQHRVEVLHPAVVIYFDIACTVLDHYNPGSIIVGPFGPELSRFRDGSSGHDDPFDLPHRAAGQLRQDIGLDLATVREALVAHLLERLEDIESGLGYIEENSMNRMRPGDAIRWMQVDDDDVEAIFDDAVFRSRDYPLTMADVASWIARATAMENMNDKHALFAEFAALEDAFEAMERQVSKAVWDIDEQANMR